LEKLELLTVHDAATVSWPTDARKPTTASTTSPVAAPWSARSGACSFGLIFFVPRYGDTPRAFDEVDVAVADFRRSPETGVDRG
jgi:uncharacterized membrane protein